MRVRASNLAFPCSKLNIELRETTKAYPLKPRIGSKSNSSVFCWDVFLPISLAAYSPATIWKAKHLESNFCLENCVLKARWNAFISAWFLVFDLLTFRSDVTLKINLCYLLLRKVVIWRLAIRKKNNINITKQAAVSMKQTESFLNIEIMNAFVANCEANTDMLISLLKQIT